MTNKLTSELIQDIYEEAVSAECFERKNVDSACFDLLCKMDEAGGLSHVIRKLIDIARAKELKLEEYRKAEPIAWINEDELPANYPYGAMFPFSKVDIVRMFPVYRPQLEAPSTANPVMFIDGDISPADTEKLVALLRECRGATPELMPGDPVLFPIQSQALRDVTAERQRQQSTKGYSTQQDDTYIGGELAAAAISYIEPMEAESYWPADWHDDSFKPSDYRRNLVKAGALILAEIERIDRQEQAPHEQ